MWHSKLIYCRVLKQMLTHYTVILTLTLYDIVWLGSFSFRGQETRTWGNACGCMYACKQLIFGYLPLEEYKPFFPFFISSFLFLVSPILTYFSSSYWSPIFFLSLVHTPSIPYFSYILNVSQYWCFLSFLSFPMMSPGLSLSSYQFLLSSQVPRSPQRPQHDAVTAVICFLEFHWRRYP